MKTEALVRYLDDLLQAGSVKDYCPNGLQVEGRPSVARVAVAVTASLAAVEAAAAFDADVLLVHHGYFWRGEDPRVVGPQQRRLKVLLGAGINLVAYHLPLDLHPEVGNNVQFGLRMGWPSSVAGGREGLIAQADVDTDARKLAAALERVLGRAPLLVGDLDRPVRRLAWCTGAAQDMLAEAAALGADAFVSGEISERTTHVARELGVIYASAGHHATERFGVQALALRLEREFGLQTRFFDDANPV